VADLDPPVRSALSGLPGQLQQVIAGHLIMAGRLLDDDPELAHQHAQAAVHRAARVGVVREAAGLTAYATGRYDEALAEFRAHRRLTGHDDYLAVVADCERGRGHPERALALARGPRAAALDRATQIELAIVAAGARRDLKQYDAAVVALQQLPELRSRATGRAVMRLRYAYADALVAANRRLEAREWFERAAALDSEDETDATDRAAELAAAIERDDR
jgi:tetratricopeptide (TPR) repeat protein